MVTTTLRNLIKAHKNLINEVKGVPIFEFKNDEGAGFSAFYQNLSMRELNLILDNIYSAPDWVELSEIADYTNYSFETLKRFCEENKVNGAKKVGRKWMVSWGILQEYAS